jgi:hypothetical protein
MSWSDIWRKQSEQRTLMHALPEVAQVTPAALAANDRLIELLEDLEFECKERDLDREHLRGVVAWQKKQLELTKGCAK